jgi:hypothetical protein
MSKSHFIRIVVLSAVNIITLLLGGHAPANAMSIGWPNIIRFHDSIIKIQDNVSRTCETPSFKQCLRNKCNDAVMSHYATDGIVTEQMVKSCTYGCFMSHCDDDATVNNNEKLSKVHSQHRIVASASAQKRNARMDSSFCGLWVDSIMQSGCYNTCNSSNFAACKYFLHELREFQKTDTRGTEVRSGPSFSTAGHAVSHYCDRGQIWSNATTGSYRCECPPGEYIDSGGPCR